MKKSIKNITIIGGGNSAHIIIPILYQCGYSLSLLTRKPKSWSHTLKLDYSDSEGKVIKEISGQIQNISSDYAKTLEDTDLVLLCLPVHIYPEVLNRIGSALRKDKEIIIGTIYGQGGFNWMAENTIRRYGLTNVEYFAFGLIPFICRTKEYGQLAVTYGSKPKNLVATSSPKLYELLNNKFLDDCCYSFFGEGRFYKAPNFISLTLSVDNQIIHPCRLFDLYKTYGGHWDKLEDVPYFYRDFTHTAAQTMAEIDGDLDKIRDAIKNKYSGVDYSLMLNYLDLEKFTYCTGEETIYDSFMRSDALCNIKTPVVKTDNGYEISKTSRFFTDDIFYGLCIYKSIAEYLEVSTQKLDDLLRWAEKTIGISILGTDNRLVEGFAGGSINNYSFDKDKMLKE